MIMMIMLIVIALAARGSRTVGPRRRLLAPIFPITYTNDMFTFVKSLNYGSIHDNTYPEHYSLRLGWLEIARMTLYLNTGGLVSDDLRLPYINYLNIDITLD